MNSYRILDEEPVAEHVCGNCTIGHRRDGRNHIASQRKGMIPTMPCKAVVASYLGDAWESASGAKLRWIVYINGRRLSTARRIARFATKESAERAGWAAMDPVVVIFGRQQRGCK